jgi:hypothetical protein
VGVYKLKEFLIVTGTKLLVVLVLLVSYVKKSKSTIGTLLALGLCHLFLITITMSNKPLFEATINVLINMNSDIEKERIGAYAIIFAFILIIYGVTFIFTSFTRKILIRHKIKKVLGDDAWGKVNDASIWSMLKQELSKKNIN